MGGSWIMYSKRIYFLLLFFYKGIYKVGWAPCLSTNCPRFFCFFIAFFHVLFCLFPAFCPRFFCLFPAFCPRVFFLFHAFCPRVLSTFGTWDVFFGFHGVWNIFVTQCVCGQYSMLADAWNIVMNHVCMNEAGMNNRIMTCADTSCRQPADTRQDNMGTLMCTSCGQ